MRLLIWRLPGSASWKHVDSTCILKALPSKLNNKRHSPSILYITHEPQHEISNNHVICASSKDSDQPVHTSSLIRAFAGRLNILWILSYWLNIKWVSKLKRRLHRLVRVTSCQNATLLEITCWCSIFSAIDLIKKMMTVDPKKRPPLSDVLNHPWFKVSQSFIYWSWQFFLLTVGL